MIIDKVFTQELKYHLIKMQEDMYLLGKRDTIKALLHVFNQAQVITKERVIAMMEDILNDDEMQVNK
jgi:hypothetical protein